MLFYAPGTCRVALLAAIAITSSSGQHPSGPNGEVVSIAGMLELVDKPPAAIPVEAVMVTIHESHGGGEVWAKPNQDGKFTLQNVPPGRYSLNITTPGRIRLFANGSKPLMPNDFELEAGDRGPLRIVVSLKTSVLSVDVAGIPDGHRAIVALLSPADANLTLRESSIVNPVSGQATQFRYTPPGKYLLFIVDSEFQRIVASSAVVRNALRQRATMVDLQDDGETRTTATYVTPDVVRQVVLQAGLDK